MKRYATIAALLITTALPLASAASAAPQPLDQYRGPDLPGTTPRRRPIAPTAPKTSAPSPSVAMTA